MCKSRAAGIICGVIVNLALFCSAAAAPVDQNSFAAAQADYNAGRYAAARDAFARFAQAYPSNSLSHYYLALCQQQTGNVASAKREYQTVIALGDPRLKIQAEAALAALSGGARARSGQSPRIECRTFSGVGYPLSFAGAVCLWLLAQRGRGQESPLTVS